MRDHDERWDSYPVQYEDGPASVIVDLGWIGDLPQTALPTLLCLIVPLKHPGSDGLGDDSEILLINDTDDSVVSRICALTDGVMVGRIRGGGRIEYYFYAPSEEGLEAAASQVRTELLRGYDIETVVQHDPDWGVYCESLFPDAATRRWMGDRSVVMRLQEAGDPLTVPRLVEHFVVFPVAADARSFAQWGRDQGFASRMEKSKVVQDQVQVVLGHDSTVDLVTINEITEMLRRQAEKAGGEYDGWETLVLRDPEDESEQSPGSTEDESDGGPEAENSDDDQPEP